VDGTGAVIPSRFVGNKKFRKAPQAGCLSRTISTPRFGRNIAGCLGGRRSARKWSATSIAGLPAPQPLVADVWIDAETGGTILILFASLSRASPAG
jgi:hypothetical protein